MAHRFPKAMLADAARSGLSASDLAALGWEYREHDDAAPAPVFGVKLPPPARPQYVLRYTTLEGKPLAGPNTSTLNLELESAKLA